MKRTALAAILTGVALAGAPDVAEAKPKKTESAAKAEVIRLTEELNKLASRGAWGGVAKAYAGILEQSEAYGYEVPIETHILGLQASMNIGIGYPEMVMALADSELCLQDGECAARVEKVNTQYTDTVSIKLGRNQYPEPTVFVEENGKQVINWNSKQNYFIVAGGFAFDPEFNNFLAGLNKTLYEEGKFTGKMVNPENFGGYFVQVNGEQVPIDLELGMNGDTLDVSPDKLIQLATRDAVADVMVDEPGDYDDEDIEVCEEDDMGCGNEMSPEAALEESKRLEGEMAKHAEAERWKAVEASYQRLLALESDGLITLNSSQHYLGAQAGYNLNPNLTRERLLLAQAVVADGSLGNGELAISNWLSDLDKWQSEYTYTISLNRDRFQSMEFSRDPSGQINWGNTENHVFTSTVMPFETDRRMLLAYINKSLYETGEYTGVIVKPETTNGYVLQINGERVPFDVSVPDGQNIDDPIDLKIKLPKQSRANRTEEPLVADTDQVEEEPKPEREPREARAPREAREVPEGWHPEFSLVAGVQRGELYADWQFQPGGTWATTASFSMVNGPLSLGVVGRFDGGNPYDSSEGFEAAYRARNRHVDMLAGQIGFAPDTPWLVRPYGDVYLGMDRESHISNAGIAGFGLGVQVPIGQSPLTFETGVYADVRTGRVIGGISPATMGAQGGLNWMIGSNSDSEPTPAQ